ncbi:unnamed protein product [Macrosiphum euphorbiae]|uniref:Uncharacterized protein n=1 Tax=Macrosiphum euphorbiae TaxID=13131 RepID=A0AAV0Y5W2_9HEMI|nr:unnamed protein product [Macrosiphum euphorbiae]
MTPGLRLYYRLMDHDVEWCCCTAPLWGGIWLRLTQRQTTDNPTQLCESWGVIKPPGPSFNKTGCTTHQCAKRKLESEHQRENYQTQLLKI